MRALKTLKENGIKTFAFVSPIIPGLIDLEKVIKGTKKFVDYYWFEFVNMRGAGKECMEAIKNHFPESCEILMNKRRLSKFIKESKKVISSQNIKIKGIEIH